MADLSDKLKALGVKVGMRDLPPSRPAEDYTIEHVVPGRIQRTPAGETFLVEAGYPAEYRHGRRELQITASLETVAAWVGEPRILACPPQSFAFLDVETTGLAGGTGTYTFLVGLGRYESDQFQLAQFFMRDPSEEPAHLLAIEQFLAPCEVLVTFNGKAFDVPLLNTRYQIQGWRSPLETVAQVDLLHMARRLWRDRLPSRTLGSLEVEILDVVRTQDDIPGWMIPQLYFDYLHTGDARPVSHVFYHNAMDVVSMAALLNHIAHLLTDPLHAMIEHDLDLVAIAKLHEYLDRHEVSIPLFHLALGKSLEDDTRQDVLHHLSFLHKRRGEMEQAIELWRQAAMAGQVYACEELAKHYEHHTRDVSEALRWTQVALDRIRAPGFPRVERRQWQPVLTHRLERLQKKLETTHKK